MSLITYEAIREAQRSEQGDQLQSLPNGFFDAVKNWIDYKKAKGDDLSLREIESAKKLLEEVIHRRQRKLLVYSIGVVRGDVPPENLDETEKEFFDQAVSLVKEFRTRMSDKILTEDGMVQKRLSEVSDIIEQIREKPEPVKEDIVEKPIEPAKEEPVVTDIPQEPIAEPVQNNDLLMGPAPEKKPGLKLLVDLPKFVGQDLNSYGPFKSGEIIHVPNQIKNLLLTRKVAEEIS
jgi:DNA replication initiation complex subunit (GINS family)